MHQPDKGMKHKHQFQNWMRMDLNLNQYEWMPRACIHEENT